MSEYEDEEDDGTPPYYEGGSAGAGIDQGRRKEESDEVWLNVPAYLAVSC